MQTLPYIVVTNPNISYVYELYYRAFERYRRIPVVRSIEENDELCKIIRETLDEHLTVIPRLAIGVLEVQGAMKPEETDKFMTTLLRSVRAQDTRLTPALLICMPAHFSPHHCRAASGSD